MVCNSKVINLKRYVRIRYILHPEVTKFQLRATVVCERQIGSVRNFYIPMDTFPKYRHYYRHTNDVEGDIF